MIVAGDGEAIAAAFGLGEVLTFEGPCARGELSQVWRLSTGSGDWAVKESFEAGGVHDHVVTTEFHEAAVAFGVPAPSVRRAADGSAAVIIGDTPVRVHGWVDLDAPDPALDPAMVGAAVAALHRVRFTGDLPAHWWNSEPVGADGWDSLIDELRNRKSPLADRFARWRDEFVALESWLAPARAVQVCHRDLFADNLRRTAAGAPCIIDWDNAGAADPNQELALVLFEFTSDELATAPILMTSYIEAGGPARVLSRQDFSMTIAVLGHLARRIGELWLAPGVTAEERVRQERRFDEYDERPFTRDVIDTLLDAIA